MKHPELPYVGLTTWTVPHRPQCNKCFSGVPENVKNNIKMSICEGPRKMSNTIKTKCHMGSWRRRCRTPRKNLNISQMSFWGPEITFVGHYWNIFLQFSTFVLTFSGRPSKINILTFVLHFRHFLTFSGRPSQIDILTYFWHFPGNPGKPLLH